MDDARSIDIGDWDQAAAEAPRPARQRTHLDRVLDAMDRDVAHSFTEAQLQALERVLANPSARRLPIDIRLTVPFFGRGYFITLLAGRERRSAARLRHERLRHRLWTVANTCCLVFVLLLSVPAAVGLFHLLAMAR